MGEGTGPLYLCMDLSLGGDDPGRGHGLGQLPRAVPGVSLHLRASSGNSWGREVFSAEAKSGHWGMASTAFRDRQEIGRTRAQGILSPGQFHKHLADPAVVPGSLKSTFNQHIYVPRTLSVQEIFWRRVSLQLEFSGLSVVFVGTFLCCRCFLFDWDIQVGKKTGLGQGHFLTTFPHFQCASSVLPS